MVTTDPASDATPLSGLHNLVRALRSSRSFIDVLEIAGEQARVALDADSLSLSQWDRDLGRLVTRVNVGVLAEGEVRRPQEEIYDLARDAVNLLEGTGFLVQAGDPAAPEPDRSILLGQGMASAIAMPVPSEGRLWGELWATRSADRAAYGDADLGCAVEVAGLIGEVIASGELLERTARMAYEDPLTRLANRRVFDDRLTELLSDGQAGATVVLCDLDGLKTINDQLGHEAGDLVIILAADSLSVAASQVDGCVAARIGGDESALILPGDVRAQAVSVAQRAARLLIRGPQEPTMSCGVAAALAGTPSRVLVATADAALYGAKHRGAQLLLSSDLRDGSHEVLQAARPARPADGSTRRRRWDDATDRPYAADAAAAVADAVQALADGLEDAPRDLPAALRWVGDTVLGPLDLDQWVLNAVGSESDRAGFVLDSLGLRHTRLEIGPLPGEADIAAEVHPLTDFPVAAEAVRDGQVYGFELGDGDDDSGLRGDTLRRMGMRFLVGAGAQDESGGWLLTVYGSTDHVPVAAVREVMALALAAVTRKDGDHD